MGAKALTSVEIFLVHNEKSIQNHTNFMLMSFNLLRIDVSFVWTLGRTLVTISICCTCGSLELCSRMKLQKTPIPRDG